MKSKNKSLKPPALNRRSIDPKSYYKNRLSELKLSPTKVEKIFRKIQSTLKISPFQLNDIFFRNIMRKKQFGYAQYSLEMAISTICASKKPLSFEIFRHILIVQNQNKSITLFLFEEKGVVWGSTGQLWTAGYFKLTEPKYLSQFKKWHGKALTSAIENSIWGTK